MTTLERLDNFRRLWDAILPEVEIHVPSGSRVEGTHIVCPPDSQIYRWISRFNDAVIEHGLTRLRSKILQGSISDADSAGRFLTAVFSSETQRRITGVTR